jgi:hypothetical protein
MLPEEDLTLASIMCIKQAERPNLFPECVWPDQRYPNSSVNVSKLRSFFCSVPPSYQNSRKKSVHFSDTNRHTALQQSTLIGLNTENIAPSCLLC